MPKTLHDSKIITQAACSQDVHKDPKRRLLPRHSRRSPTSDVSVLDDLSIRTFGLRTRTRKFDSQTKRALFVGTTSTQINGSRRRRVQFTSGLNSYVYPAYVARETPGVNGRRIVFSWSRDKRSIKARRGFVVLRLKVKTVKTVAGRKRLIPNFNEKSLLLLFIYFFFFCRNFSTKIRIYG